MMFNIRFKLCAILFLITTMFNQTSIALTQQEELWLAVNYQTTISCDKQWLGFVFSQLRSINQSHPIHEALIEFGLGHAVRKDDTAWIGYRWVARNPYNNFTSENRFFQQYIFINKYGWWRILLRNRLEQIQRSNSSQIAIRLRERLTAELKSCANDVIFPVLYDEIFFQLKSTDFTSSRGISINRIFIGFNYIVSKSSWWELGYINEYHIDAGGSGQNELSHIISVTYNM